VVYHGWKYTPEFGTRFLNLGERLEGFSAYPYLNPQNGIDIPLWNQCYYIWLCFQEISMLNNISELQKTNQDTNIMDIGIQI
jgi:hypothetical protein